MSSQSARHKTLLATASSFCQSLINPPPPTELINQCFTTINPRVTEHGPEWAKSRLPFLSKTFTGASGCEEYFSLLSQTLKMKLEKDAFPGPEGYVLDTEAVTGQEDANAGLKGVVSVVGKGSFQSIKTGKEWQEEFIYRFSGFDEDGKIGHWEIWADPLSAWVAVGE